MKQRIYKEYHNNGKLRRKIYYLGDKKATEDSIQIFKWHRTDGPAIIKYDENGKKEYEAWRVDDKLHRTDGPATILYDEDGKKEVKRWFVDEEELDEEEVEKLKIIIELRKEVEK